MYNTLIRNLYIDMIYGAGMDCGMVVVQTWYKETDHKAEVPKVWCTGGGLAVHDPVMWAQIYIV